MQMSLLSTSPYAVDLASSMEIEDDVARHVDYFLRLRDENVREEYGQFQHCHQTLSSLKSINSFIFVFSLPYYAILLLGLIYAENDFDIGSSSTVFALFLLINAIVWKVYYQQKNSLQYYHHHLSEKSKKFLDSFQKGIFLCLHIIVCYRHLIRVVQGSCHRDDSLTRNWNCNPLAHQHALTMETSILAMLMPIVYMNSTKGAHLGYSLFLWAITMSTLIFSVIYSDAINAVTFVFFYAICSLYMLMEAKVHHYYLFFTHRKLLDILREREKAADEANAQELRHMIANVAHDLKTPLSSFMAGVECVGQVISEVYAKKENAKKQCLTIYEEPGNHGEVVNEHSCLDVDEWLSTVTNCITNMRNTNSFMLMTINRCIDYTKASKGVKLVPKFETIDLMDTLSLPLNCMKDIQQRVSIVLQPINKEICSCIITDKQWLQENVLCLLSNAVKYSNEGEVTISVDVVQRENYLGRGSKVITPRSSTIFPMTYSVNDDHSYRSNYSAASSLYCAGYLRVEVEDHGIGLSEDAMSTLFSPFKQAQRLAGGTGLGLFSLAKRLEALEGGCGVQRRRDGEEGSLFWFEIPYRPDREAEMVVKRSFDHFVSIPGSTLTATQDWRGSKENLSLLCSISESPTARMINQQRDPIKSVLDILLVDDSPTILKMISMMFKRHKHTVSMATNGMDAFSVVQERYDKCQQPFDAILMDLQMPVMDGLEATKRIRALEHKTLFSSNKESSDSSSKMDESTVKNKWVNSPKGSQRRLISNATIIIGVSANSDSDTAAQAFDAGVDAFIAKPFSIDAFYTTYLQAINSRK